MFANHVMSNLISYSLLNKIEIKRIISIFPFVHAI